MSPHRCCWSSPSSSPLRKCGSGRDGFTRWAILVAMLGPCGSLIVPNGGGMGLVGARSVGEESIFRRLGEASSSALRSSPEELRRSRRAALRLVFMAGVGLGASAAVLRSGSTCNRIMGEPCALATVACEIDAVDMSSANRRSASAGERSFQCVLATWSAARFENVC